MNTAAPTGSPQTDEFIFISDEEKKKDIVQICKDREETEKWERLLKEGTAWINKEGIIEKVPSIFVIYGTNVFAFCKELYENISSVEKKSKEAVDLSDKKSDEQDENISLEDFSLEEE